MPRKTNKKKAELDLILFDFHNTLSNSLFYAGMEKKHPEISERLSKNIFTNKNKFPLLKKWMKGGHNYKEFNKIVATEINCNHKILDTYLESSIKKMSINKELLSFAKDMRKRGIKIIIFTDNMDPFTKMVVPHFKLNKIFDEIISSWEHKRLKEERNGRFIDLVLEKRNIEIKKTLLIDDSHGIDKIMRAKGGHSYLYKDYSKEFPKFNNWFKKNFL